MFEKINRRRVQAESREILRSAQVSYKAFFALYLGILTLANVLGYLASAPGAGNAMFNGPADLFVTIFSALLAPILAVGTYLYCMAVRRGEEAEVLTLFDGFSFAGKIILLYLLQAVFIFLWTMLFIIPGIIAAYRYRFAYLNLCANPNLSAMDALNLSKKQTTGYKKQLLQLDLSYLGWMLLSALPAIVLSALVWDPTLFDSIAYNPLYLLAEQGFAFLFGLLYIPNYCISEVAYFETAVRTSGLNPEFTESPNTHF